MFYFSRKIFILVQHFRFILEVQCSNKLKLQKLKLRKYNKLENFGDHYKQAYVRNCVKHIYKLRLYSHERKTRREDILNFARMIV